MLTVGSLFAGIGGFDLGLERTGGFEIVWQCEIDPYCQRVLAKHWPHIKRYGDIRELRDVEPVDVLCGGFPCQDISNAGKRAGIDGERSGLWSEYVRVIRLVRPRYVLVENVAALLGRGMGRVLGDLFESGYDAEWEGFSAAEFGLPHKRYRMFLLAYTSSLRRIICDDPTPVRSQGQCLQDHEQSGYRWQRKTRRHCVDAVGWSVEPGICGSGNGIPNQLDRLHGLGNAIVPQIATWIGQRILDYEAKP